MPSFALFLYTVIGAFVIVSFIVNAKSFLRRPKHNRIIVGNIDAIEFLPNKERWLIKWRAPLEFAQHNPKGPQIYYHEIRLSAKRGTSVGPVELSSGFHEQALKKPVKTYEQRKREKKLNKKFYLSALVDATGVIRDIRPYRNYLPQVIVYGAFSLLWLGLLSYVV